MNVCCWSNSATESGNLKRGLKGGCTDTTAGNVGIFTSISLSLSLIAAGLRTHLEAKQGGIVFVNGVSVRGCLALRGWCDVTGEGITNLDWEENDSLIFLLPFL